MAENTLFDILNRIWIRADGASVGPLWWETFTPSFETGVWFTSECGWERYQNLVLGSERGLRVDGCLTKR